MKERRRYPRLDIDLPVILRHDGRFIPATILNLSCGGMCIRTDGADLVADKPAEIIFDLGEDNRDLSLRGEIVRRDADDSSSAGIQFTNLFSEGYTAVQEYLRTHLN